VNRLKAIEIIIGMLKNNELLIHANGAISRESFYIKNRKRNFYMLGSMGLASSIGMGVAISNPDKKVIILDGDGNILMGMGNMAMIGVHKSENLTHIVLDNKVYSTTGNQPTITDSISLTALAKASGYRMQECAENEKQLKNILKKSFKVPGPHFIQVKVSKNIKIKCPRISYSASEIKERFIKSIKT